MGSGYLTVTDPRAAAYILSNTEVYLYSMNTSHVYQILIAHLSHQSRFQKSYRELGALASLDPCASTNMTTDFRLAAA
jgi:hypothetical protein